MPAAKTMFTQSCSNVKAPHIALARISFDLTSGKPPQQDAGAGEDKMASKMISKILSLARKPSAPGAFAHGQNGTVSAEKVRALATGAALAVALDASPAVLVSIYDYAYRLRDQQRRPLPC
jgi:hypothetical protein